MRLLVIATLLFVQHIFGNTPFWGQTGHRVVGEVASENIKNSTKRKIEKLLDGQSLAMVATYADEIKSDKRYRSFSPWHYVNFPFDKKYTEVTPSEDGDIITGIEKCISVLKDENATNDDKVFYLKMLIHLVGDLHQPLHVGRAEDKGGNDIQVRWFGDGSNLHRVWDSDMIDSYGMSYTELSENLPKYSKTQRKIIVNGSILDWAEESQNLAIKVYESAEVGEKLGYNYMYDHFSTVQEQLKKGGLRLAKILDDIF
ncbi:S1/P1 nuclease [Galbibacter mesophilus]|uniref:S1/P1 nuclease n=1 Tax=Galbibacter mesophilus TaxID=379069 RepID=UPI00191F1AF2|nr:S1/P1 nuclease [Galbibacter mesophilus]MCM5661551.1 S1/P1 nuclease [Galbibacter mesophilus]